MMAADMTMDGGNGGGRAKPSDNGSDGGFVPSIKTETVFRAARRHSRRVRVFRIVLPLVAVVCIAVFSWFTFLATPPSVSVTVSSAGIENGKLVMTNPKLSGFTGNNLPYSMTAARATQAIGNTNVFTLEKIDAKLPLTPEQTAKLQAGSGVYDNVKQSLKLADGVTVTTSDGMVAKLNSADVDIATGKMRTNEPVDIKNGDSNLTADSMSISKRDGLVIFENRVELTLDPGALKKSAPQADAGATRDN